jgi:tetratricopeptide (TPR) repeat protein
MGPSDLDAGGLPARRLAVIFFLALGLRLAAWAELRSSPWLAVPIGDARVFDEWGARIARGEWRPREVFYQAPLYPYVLGGMYALVGHAPGAVRALQCLLGALAALWIAAAARRVAGGRAGLVAGLLAAGYAPAMAYDLQLEKSSLAFALSALLLWLSVARCDPPRGRGPFLAGLVLGALTLLRENAAILLLPLAVFLARGSGARRAIASLAGGFALALLPVAASNQRLGGVPLPTAANAGVNFYIGNGAEADGMYRPLVAGRGHPDHEREDAARIARDLAGKELSPAGVSRFWFALAWSEIRAEPGRFLARLVAKLRLLAHHREVMDAVALEVYQDGSRLLRGLGLLSFGLLLPLAAVGASRTAHRRRQGLALWCAGLLALSILAFFVAGRFRLGLVPFLVPLAALGLSGWRDDPRRARSLAVLAAAGALAWWPLPAPGDARATSAANLASELLRRGDAAGAEPWAREARARDPDSADAAFNLGVVLRARAAHAEAAQHFEAALRLEPDYRADCLAELGAIRALLGDGDEAERLLREALALDPQHAEARRYMEALVRSRARGSG